MHHTRHNTQHVTQNMQYSTWNTLRATHNTQYMLWKTQHAIHDMQHGKNNIQRCVAIAPTVIGVSRRHHVLEVVESGTVRILTVLCLLQGTLHGRVISQMTGDERCKMWWFTLSSDACLGSP